MRPLAQARVNKALSLAVGVWRIGFGSQKTQAKPAHQASGALGSVPDAVVGHDASDTYAQA